MKTLTIAGLSILLLALLFQCCPSATPEPPAVPEKSPTAVPTEAVVATAAPTHTVAPPPTPAEVLWTLDIPEWAVQTLWAIEVVTDEGCLDCIMGDLISGTQLRPGPGGCRPSEWDPTYVYCNVEVLSGELAGQWGWVNQQYIDK